MSVRPYPLSRPNRIRLAQAFHNIPRVDISIDCVLEDQMGEAFVDDVADPKAFKIQIGPFVYLAGAPAEDRGQAVLSSVQPYAMIMAAAPGWREALKKIFGDHMTLYPRYQFSTGSLQVERLNALEQASPWKEQVERMDVTIAQAISARPGPWDISDFESPEDFYARGIGYCLRQDGQVVAAAYSSLVCSYGIEISIYVDEPYRRQGVATALSCALLKWCLANNMDPHWDAANEESKKLAEKLGYVYTGSYSMFYIWK